MTAKQSKIQKKGLMEKLFANLHLIQLALISIQLAVLSRQLVLIHGSIIGVKNEKKTDV